MCALHKSEFLYESDCRVLTHMDMCAHQIQIIIRNAESRLILQFKAGPNLYSMLIQVL